VGTNTGVLVSYFFPLNCRVTPQLLASAQTAADQIPLLNNSIRGGGGTLVGCIGEEGFQHLFPGSVSQNTFQHDNIWNGWKIEIKTKQRKVTPRIDYSVSVSAYNATQKADVYAFMSVYCDEATGRYIRVHFCGFYPTADYCGDATFYNKGDYDPDNGYTAQADCYNLKMRELIR